MTVAEVAALLKLNCFHYLESRIMRTGLERRRAALGRVVVEVRIILTVLSLGLV